MTQPQSHQMPTRNTGLRAMSDGALADDALDKASGGTTANVMKSSNDTQGSIVANNKAS